MNVNRFPDRKIIIENQKYLYFGGTSYLGLPTNKKFIKIISKSLKKWGTAYGSSRNANIKLKAYEKAEQFLAHFIKAEAALTISSGMLAGKIVIDVLEKQTDSFYHFPNLHAALKHKNSLPIFENNSINQKLVDGISEKVTILTDAVPSLSVQAIDLGILLEISSNKEITLVVDESHSLGLLGENGCGIYSNINLRNVKHKIMIASLGKAMGTTGGVIASNAEFINKVKINNNYVSAAGMNASFAVSLSKINSLIIKQNRKLKQNLKFVDKILLKCNQVLFDVNYPILYPKIKNVYSILQGHKIIITNFAYPNDEGELNRIVITANHKKKDLRKIISILNYEHIKSDESNL